MSDPLVVLDADVLGRHRTGDETYVLNLLRELPRVADDLRFAAVTRRPDLVPAGVEPIELPAGRQELRMAWSLPRLLRRLRPAVAHFQHALPLRYASPAVVTVHDLSFERDRTLMSRWDRLMFRTQVPRAVRRAERVLAVSERTKRDVVELYGVEEEKVVVTPNGVDPAFAPGPAGSGDYLLFVGAIQPRKDPLAAVDAAAAVGLPLAVAGPVKDESLAAELERRGARMHGYVEKDRLADLYRGAAAVVLPSRFEGFGLPVLEAMACGTPVVGTNEPALVEVANGAAVLVPRERLAEGVRTALADRDRLVAAGLERAKLFTWAETARRTAAVYRELVQ